MTVNASKITFTRYLYIKDEVQLALLVSILNKSEKSLFWAYELYYSGFHVELFNLLWKIYFDFYYTLNPGFYKYFTKKQKEWENSLNTPEKDDVVVGNIVYNLMRRTTATLNNNNNENENKINHFSIHLSLSLFYFIF